MKSLAEFQTDFDAATGDLASLATDPEVESWLNEGRTRIGIYDRKTATLTWDAGDTTVPLPADFYSMGRVRPGTSGIPSYTEWGKTLVFDREEGAQAAGTATVFYNAYYPVIDALNDSELPEEADRGLLSYALYRFFQKLSANRMNYRKYATLAGQNAVQIEDLQAEASRQYDDFLDAGASLPPLPPAYFYGGSG